jgi:5-methylcytosine-specific restriction endonuclease McrA
MRNTGPDNPNWKGGISKKEFVCTQCGKHFFGHHSRKARFCSVECKCLYQKTLVGQKSPSWRGGVRSKTCAGCGTKFKWASPKPLSVFTRQKFCTKLCADKHGKRYSGEEHPNWVGGHKGRDKHKQNVWSKKVLQRCDYTCGDCGKRGGDLHAHHIKSYINHPRNRWNIKNGIALCLPCHYKTYKFHSNQYTDMDEKGVNSGEVKN